MPSKNPRVNVTVTEEQHKLLLELGALQGSSASAILRSQLDAATPLLRAALPLLRKAAEETAVTQDQAARLLAEPLRLLREAMPQDELYEAEKVVGRATGRRASGAERASGSTRSA